ncbi:hypothetical protein AVEN_12603-1 [Araneus ventricosus]|uniref:Tc1-like transposase DDE domain-containing protein n=1 Tax=Araneus ventricosus TaxID=182803 RepID=A0A4Y2ABG7_ARAVE|nr:hypothetical protein AVEN_12603-1 [Araneus ventricosus]
MNIIEAIWDALLHAVEKRSPPPRTPMDLLTALQDSWCEFPPGYLQTPVESMPRIAVRKAGCGPKRKTTPMTITEDRFRQQEILPYVRLFQGAIDPNFVFMDNSAKPHRTRSAKGLLKSANITQ